jgi:hypothetical protein
MNSSLKEFVADGYAIGVTNPDDSCEAARKIWLTLHHPESSHPDRFRPMTWEAVVQRISAIYLDKSPPT